MIIPMGSKCSIVSLTSLQSMFAEFGDTVVSTIDLALVGADGSITTYKLFGEVKPPPEGTNQGKRLGI